jgi:tetratricopeptide (TPR) repeat protein
MSLMNDALRKKNREATGAPEAPGFSEAVRQPRPTRKRWAVLTAATLTTAAALIGIHLWQPDAGGSLLMKTQPSAHSRPSIHLAARAASQTQRPADVQSEPVPTGAGMPATGIADETPGTAGRLSPEPVSTPVRATTTPEAAAARLSAVGQDVAKPMATTVSPEPETTGAPAGASRETIDTASRAFEPGPRSTIQVGTPPASTPRRERAQSAPPPPRAQSTGAKTPVEPVRQPAEPDQDTELFYKKARSYHRSGRLSEAIRFYRQVLKLRPHHPAAMLNLAAATMQMGNYSDALPLLKLLEQSQPRPRGVLLNLAIAAIGVNDPEQALSYLDRANEESDASPWDIRFHRALSFSRMNRLPEALALYREAETERPDDPRLQFNLAVTCDALGLYPQALVHYEAALRTASNRPETDSATLAQRIRTIQQYLDRATSPEKGP